MNTSLSGLPFMAIATLAYVRMGAARVRSSCHTTSPRLTLLRNGQFLTRRSAFGEFARSGVDSATRFRLSRSLLPNQRCNKMHI